MGVNINCGRKWLVSCGRLSSFQGTDLKRRWEERRLGQLPPSSGHLAFPSPSPHLSSSPSPTWDGDLSVCIFLFLILWPQPRRGTSKRSQGRRGVSSQVFFSQLLPCWVTLGWLVLNQRPELQSAFPPTRVACTPCWLPIFNKPTPSGINPPDDPKPRVITVLLDYYCLRDMTATFVVSLYPAHTWRQRQASHKHTREHDSVDWAEFS